MTPEEQKVATDLLIESLNLRVLAAQRYRELLEWVVPLLEGDADIIREMRKEESRVESWCNSVKAGLPHATPENWKETFATWIGNET